MRYRVGDGGRSRAPLILRRPPRAGGWRRVSSSRASSWYVHPATDQPSLLFANQLFSIETTMTTTSHCRDCLYVRAPSHPSLPRSLPPAPPHSTAPNSPCPLAKGRTADVDGTKRLLNSPIWLSSPVDPPPSNPV